MAEARRRLIGLAISIFANYLLFFWIFWRLPRHRPRRKALFRGTLIAAIGFEIIKIVMTWTLPALVKSPLRGGVRFGAGADGFFYFFCPPDAILRRMDRHRGV